MFVCVCVCVCVCNFSLDVCVFVCVCLTLCFVCIRFGICVVCMYVFGILLMCMYVFDIICVCGAKKSQSKSPRDAKKNAKNNGKLLFWVRKKSPGAENKTFQKFDKSAPGEDSGRTAAWKILGGGG